jgi:hypothetical protein
LQRSVMWLAPLRPRPTPPHPTPRPYFNRHLLRPILPSISFNYPPARPPLSSPSPFPSPRRPKSFCWRTAPPHIFFFSRTRGEVTTTLFLLPCPALLLPLLLSLDYVFAWSFVLGSVLALAHAWFLGFLSQREAPRCVKSRIERAFLDRTISSRPGREMGWI